MLLFARHYPHNVSNCSFFLGHVTFTFVFHSLTNQHFSWLFNDFVKIIGTHTSLFCSLFNRSVVSKLFDPMDYNWLLCPWISSGKNTGVGCHSLYQGIFLTQGSNPSLPHCRQILYCLSHHEERKPHINLYLYVCVCVCITIYTCCFIIKDSTKNIIYLYFF